MNLKPHIPNAITVLNLLCGSIAVIFLFNGLFLEAAALTGLAAAFDFFDGFVAKLLNAKSPIGKELDSLADVISFGLVPSLFMYKLISSGQDTDTSFFQTAVPYFALSIAAFSALRLAKFNLDTRQSNSFIGLPVPANAIFIISFVMVALYDDAPAPFLNSIASNLWVQLTVVAVSSFLLVSEIPMFAMKFSKGYGIKENKVRYTFLLLSLISIVLLGWTGIAMTIVIYILMSLVFRDR